MTRETWVVAEHWRGQLCDVSFETLALGREVANARGTELRALLLGSGIAHLAGQLGLADTVLSVDDPELAAPMGPAHVEALYQLAQRRQPLAIFIPLTNVTLGVGTLLAARLGSAAVNFCTNVRVNDGVIEAQSLLYAGKIETVVRVTAQPAILCITSGARAPESGRSARVPAVEDVRLALPHDDAIQFVRFIEPESGDVDITKEDVLVGVGRGIQSKDNLEIAEEFACGLGGVVCASRPVVDQGWLPLSRQVGKSGKTVRPRLYVAVGISGAPEHVEGMRKSTLIVAINTDAGAPIFSVAHYGVVADAIEFLPALTRELEKRKAQVSHA